MRRADISRLNFRSVPNQTTLGLFLSTPRPMRNLGSVFSLAHASDSQTLGLVDLKASFDTLIFVKESHAAHSFEVQPLVSPH